MKKYYLSLEELGYLPVLVDATPSADKQEMIIVYENAYPIAHILGRNRLIHKLNGTAIPWMMMKVLFELAKNFDLHYQNISNMKEVENG